MVLLFKPYHVPLILNGKKTQTRRKWDRPRVKVGNTYQARTQLFGKPFAHLRVKRVWKEPIITISDSDAAAEGYPHAEAFLIMWGKNFGRLGDVVWAVEFERAPDEGLGDSAHP